MNILVYDVAADGGGAATILEHFYELHKQDKSNHYYYLLSTYHLENTDNITIINVAKVRKGWRNRILFDLWGAKKYLKKYHIEEVLSLQNISLPCFKGYQTVYVHNALPFAEYKFSLREDRYLWIYQNIIGSLIKRSIKKANKVIVQTEWMKDAIVKEMRKTPNNLQVVFPDIKMPEGYRYCKQENVKFFYPANSSAFKNHKLILEACKILKEKRVTNYTIVFTLNGNETSNIKEIYSKAIELGLDFKWIGSIERKKVFDWYEKSVLLFPSYIETIGLPILEARAVKSPILLSDCLYSKSIAGNYELADFFKYDDPETLAKLMAKFI